MSAAIFCHGPCGSGVVINGSLFCVALTFPGLGLMPSFQMICPKYWISVFPNWHLSLFSFSPEALIVCITVLRFLPWSSLSLPKTRISSITTTVPGWSLRRVLIFCWNISGADLIPNGSLRKQIRPTGVMKFVSFLLSMSSGICQNPLEASTVEKTVAPVSCGAMSSSVGKINLSRFTALLSFVKSTHILGFLLFLITGTIGAHQSVPMSPKTSSYDSSLSTLRTSPILRAVAAQAGSWWMDLPSRISRKCNSPPYLHNQS